MKLEQSGDIRAVLFDLDGVLYIGNTLLPGAAECVQYVKGLGLPVAGVTNTTTSPRRAIAKKLADLGIPMELNNIYTPAALAVQAIGSSTAQLYVQETLLEDFGTVALTKEKPDFIVMGDLGDRGYTPAVLHRIFNQVMDGSTLLALHKNRFWQKPDGLHLDIGPFVTAIEYATDTQAIVLGKPSQAFFNGVCIALHVYPETALMIGDDIESDIAGAQQAGLRTALVQTGKYRRAFAEQTGIRPDLLIPSIAELPEALQRL